jgi:hypothetical protein
VRAVWVLCVVAATVAATGGVARAHTKVCEVEELMTPAPPDEDAPAPLPLDRHQCGVAGHDDAGCWPDDAAPMPGPRVPLRFDAGLLLCAAHAALAPTMARQPRVHADERPLAEGHGRRIDRPPRSIAI